MYPDYSRLERVADGSMHAIGLLGATCGGALLLVWASRVASPWEMAAIAIYAVTLIATFAASAFYHMTPWESLRPALRRIDHAAIYLKIAGTYTPLVVMIGSGLSYFVLGVVWLLAIIGITLKLLFWSAPGRMGPALYLIMGWMSIILFWTSWSQVPFGFIAAGGLLYTVGVIFYAAKTLKFANRHMAWLRHRGLRLLLRGHHHRRDTARPRVASLPLRTGQPDRRGRLKRRNIPQPSPSGRLTRISRGRILAFAAGALPCLASTGVDHIEENLILGLSGRNAGHRRRGACGRGRRHPTRSRVPISTAAAYGGTATITLSSDTTCHIHWSTGSESDGICMLLWQRLRCGLCVQNRRRRAGGLRGHGRRLAGRRLDH